MAFLWETFVRPAMFRMEAEPAHELGVKALRSGWAAPFYTDAKGFGTGPLRRFGLDFANPVGIAAGFDKNAAAVNQLASLRFGSVEIGTVTHKPQMGNPKPRMFRLPDDKAVINRLGFNNEGAEAVAKRLAAVRRKCVVGVNIGKNKNVPNEDATENYLAAFRLLHSFADYVVVNISSPNTPNLRELQKSENLDELLAELQRENGKNRSNASGNERGDRVAARTKPLLVKIAPDLTEAEVEAAVDTCRKHGVAGIIATNTTISREGLRTPNVTSLGAGGLSGRPLTRRATEVVSLIYKHTKGELPIVGVGGILDAADAFDKIAAGASLVQAYTGFIYAGPTFARDVNEGLAKILKERGFGTVDEAVGSAAGNA